jgi:Zn-dependent protease
LEQLAAKARLASQSGELASALSYWRQCLPLLPPDTVQYASIQARIYDLAAASSTPHPGSHASPWKKGGFAAIGSVLLLLLTKGKFLLLGLTKMSTLLSMFAWVGVYWSLFGWWFALGSVFSIYIHEMGHVMALRRYGIAATAPMFIPGLGAFIRMKQGVISVVEDARVGLAGPVYGLGAALAALLVAYATGSKIWAAIAHFGAVINLFNLIPVWQLDGSRGFRSLTRYHRMVVLIAALLLWRLTSEGMLFLIAIGAVYRLFTRDAPPEPDVTGFVQFAGLLAALAAVGVLSQNITQWVR